MTAKPLTEAQRHEGRATIAVLVGALLIATVVGAATIPKPRIAEIRANGGYVLVDNRTRRAVVATTENENGRPCGRAHVGAGNRERVRACGAWSWMVVRGRGGEPARLMAAQGQVYQVRWRGGLQAEQHDAF